MSDETTPEPQPVDEHGVLIPTPTSEGDESTPNPDHVDAPADERDVRIAGLEAQLAAAEDRIAELESSPPSEGGNDFGGVRTPALDAFEENQFKGEVQAWERDTGLSYEDTEPEEVG